MTNIPGRKVGPRAASRWRVPHPTPTFLSQWVFSLGLLIRHKRGKVLSNCCSRVGWGNKTPISKWHGIAPHPTPSPAPFLFSKQNKPSEAQSPKRYCFENYGWLRRQQETADGDYLVQGRDNRSPVSERQGLITGAGILWCHKDSIALGVGPCGHGTEHPQPRRIKIKCSGSWNSTANNRLWFTWPPRPSNPHPVISWRKRKRA